MKKCVGNRLFRKQALVDPSRVESIFLAALALETAEARAAYLDDACRDHPDLREQADRLLAAHPKAVEFLEQPAAQAVEKTALFVPPREQTGSILSNKYKLIEEIGEGGMGNVYMALQTEPVKRTVAVKVIKAGMDSKAVMARFEAERQALALMDHPNIARVLDAGATETGRPFFVMELVKGIPITQYCDERKLKPRERLELFVPVCNAIQHAHQKGIIHRDIKPSNVLVAMYDDRPVPKVIDFGVAKATGQALTDRTLMTGFGAVVGTPEYMSPEQANMNNMDIDTRSDVYSLGVLLYELLTGTTPVDRKSLGKAALLEILRIVREVEAPRPSAKLSTIDTLPSVAANCGTDPGKLSKLMKGELDWVLLKALAKDRTRRYETANGFASDIKRYLANEPVVARPPSTAYRVQKTWQRNKVAFVTVSAISASLVVGIAVSVWQAILVNREAKRAVAALDELRETAPAFLEQARGLAAKEQFAEAIEKLDYATKLRPDEPEYHALTGDLLQCQFRFAEAAKAYRAALKLSPGNTHYETSAALCEELLIAPASADGKLTRESLSKLSLAMQQQQRPAAELMRVARLLGEEKKHVVAYWIERLKVLPITADMPLEKRLTVRDDGLLALDLHGTKTTDLLPLAGAPLAVLNLSGADSLVDISILRGMKLIELRATRTKITDLSPLRDMSTLETLTLGSTPVLDLSSLRGLRLRKLDLSGCPVNDISPLHGAPLEQLFLGGTRVTDLSPLAGMPLKSIDLTRTPVLDFTPLVGLPLESVVLQYSRLSDLAVLRGMPLRELTLWGCTDARNYAVLADIKTLELLLLPIEYRNLPTNDIAAIGALRSHPKLRQIGSDVMNQMNIAATGSKEVFWKDWDREQTFVPALRKSGFKFSLSKLPDGTYWLSLEFQPVSDLSILKGAPISELWLSGCKVTDLDPIRGLPLKVLGLFGNPVEDLKPLSKMPLEELYLDKTPVSDLSALKSLRLRKLYLHDCDKLTDISVLVEIPTLVSLTVPVYSRDVENLHKLPNLKLLAFGDSGQRSNSTPNSTAEQFWSDREANPWLTQLRDSGLKITELKQLPDRTWEVKLDGSTIGDLTFLTGAPISSLSIGGTAVTDLEPLRGMAMKSLAIWNTKVTDLSPLKGMKLDYLNLAGTEVTNLSSIARHAPDFAAARSLHRTGRPLATHGGQDAQVSHSATECEEYRIPPRLSQTRTPRLRGGSEQFLSSRHDGCRVLE